MCREQKQTACKGCKLPALKVATCNLQTTLKIKKRQRKIKKRYFLYFCTSTKNIFEMGKITVKHYLNTKEDYIDLKGNKLHPIYIMIIFNRMTIRKRSIHLIEFTATTEKEFNEKSYSKFIKEQLEYEETLIYKIVEKFKNDFENNCISKNFLNFNSKQSYRSKNENLNLLNSYLNYYTSKADIFVLRFESKEVEKDLVSTFEKALNFSRSKKLLNNILDIVDDTSDMLDIFPYFAFRYDNISERGKKLMFLNHCFREFYMYRKQGYCALYEMFFEFDEIEKEYRKSLSKNKLIKEVVEVNGFDLENEINFQLSEIKKLFHDPLFYEKYRI